MSLSQIVEKYEPKLLERDYMVMYGNLHDGVIEFPAITRDNQIIEVGSYFSDHKKLKPKNIIGIAPQAGCPSKCGFCEYGVEPYVRDVTPDEMYEQVMMMLDLEYRLGVNIDTEKHKVSIARGGEPLLNDRLIEGMEKIAQHGMSFKVSTVFPYSKKIENMLYDVARFDAQHDEPVQIQLSLISTSEEYRKSITGIRVATFEEIRRVCDNYRNINPDGRTFNVSLILSEETPCNVDDVAGILPPSMFNFRFRPYVPNQNGESHSLEKIDGDKLNDLKNSFRDKGYDIKSWATPTPIEEKFRLSGSVTRHRYLRMLAEEI
ncbi:MAG: radical SAM protein [Nanoarchaeota archaeon]